MNKTNELLEFALVADLQAQIEDTLVSQLTVLHRLSSGVRPETDEERALVAIMAHYIIGVLELKANKGKLE